MGRKVIPTENQGSEDEKQRNGNPALCRAASVVHAAAVAGPAPAPGLLGSGCSGHGLSLPGWSIPQALDLDRERRHTTTHTHNAVSLERLDT
jgi:hypothetical protein